MTYWSSQSFRTLTHWQSGAKAPDVPMEESDFSILSKIEYEGITYMMPAILGWSNGRIGYAYNNYIYGRQDFTYGEGRLLKGFKASIDGKSVYIGAINLGEEELTPKPVTRGSNQSVIVRTTQTQRIKEFAPGEEALFDSIVPTVKRIFIYYGWADEGYESLIPSWMLTDNEDEYINPNPNAYVARGTTPWYTYGGYGLNDTINNTKEKWWVKCKIPKGSRTSYTLLTATPTSVMEGFVSSDMVPGVSEETTMEGNVVAFSSGCYSYPNQSSYNSVTINTCTIGRTGRSAYNALNSGVEMITAETIRFDSNITLGSFGPRFVGKTLGDNGAIMGTVINVPTKLSCKKLLIAV